MIVIQYLTGIYVNIREHKVHKVLGVLSQTYLKKNADDSWMNSIYGITKRYIQNPANHLTYGTSTKKGNSV